jgi:hypothetical protein
MVQEPAEAAAPSMPQSAMENVAIDYCLPLSKMAEALVRLTRSEKKTERELRPGVRIMLSDEQPLEHPTAQTCPEWGGAMREETAPRSTGKRVKLPEFAAATNPGGLRGTCTGWLWPIRPRELPMPRGSLL